MIDGDSDKDLGDWLVHQLSTGRRMKDLMRQRNVSLTLAETLIHASRARQKKDHEEKKIKALSAKRTLLTDDVAKSHIERFFWLNGPYTNNSDLRDAVKKGSDQPNA